MVTKLIQNGFIESKFEYTSQRVNWQTKKKRELKKSQKSIGKLTQTPSTCKLEAKNRFAKGNLYVRVRNAF